MSVDARTDLTSVYLEKRDSLRRYFTMRLNSEAAAEDLVQDIYLRLVNAQIGPIENPVAYLYRLGTNLMLDRIKQRRRREARDDAWQDSRFISAGGESVDNEPAPDDAVSDRQRLAKLMAAVEQLPDQRRTAFKLHKLDGFSHAATAATMGISRSAVEKHIMAALRQLLPLIRE